MTKIKIFKKDNSIVKVESIGHAETVNDGEFSIICAGISTILQSALLGLITVAGIEVSFNRDDKKGKLAFSIPDNLAENKKHDADIILNTMFVSLVDFREGYSDFIELEVL